MSLLVNFVLSGDGTGKSTLLTLLFEFIAKAGFPESFTNIPFLLVKLRLNAQDIYVFKSSQIQQVSFFRSEVESITDWKDELLKSTDYFTTEFGKSISYQIIGQDEKNTIDELLLKPNSTDIIIYAPSESTQNSNMEVADVPLVNLNEALRLFKELPFQNVVAGNNVGEFWRILIYLIKKRDNEREVFENSDSNINRTKKELIGDFERLNPKILDKLAVLWNKILDKAGLEFDAKNASDPIQLNDNLLAYIRLKSTKQQINYNQLSTGIRNFIFRVGHIYSLYFNREIKRGFLLIDEPENSLFPDFLFDLIEAYQTLLIDKNGENNTQFFVSTHNPIIAAQFEPFERIVLEWNDSGYVDAYKGIAPAGDDPNDVLTKDFGLKNLMGKRGQEMWGEYLQLKKDLRKANDEREKEELISQINKIGTDYNFED